MSGIVGIWNLDGAPVEPELLDKLNQTIRHRGADGQRVWLDGAVGLGHQLFRVTPESRFELQPLISPSGVVLVYDGRLDNRDELLAELGDRSRVSSQSPDPDIVLAAYEAFGLDFAPRLNGDFAFGLFDPNEQRLVLVRDAIGVRPLYYTRAGNTFVFASEIKGLLAHPDVVARPDDDTLAGYLIAGRYRRDEATFFAEIYTLPPGHLAVLTSDRLAVRRYWDFDLTRQIRLGSFGEYAEAFREHFCRAVRRRIRSLHPVAVLVSGGLDSSSIYCAAESIRRAEAPEQPGVVGVSFAPEDGSPADESSFLRHIERHLGNSINRVSKVPMQWLDSSEEQAWQAECPYIDPQRDTQAQLLNVARQSGARVLLTGHWGDQMLWEQSYLLDLFCRLKWGQIRHHLKGFVQSYSPDDPTVFRREFFRQCAQAVVPPSLVSLLRRGRDSLRGMRSAHPWYTPNLSLRARSILRSQDFAKPNTGTFHARALYRDARSAHYVGYMESNNKIGNHQGLEEAFVFLDRDLISYLMAIPGEVQSQLGVYKGLFREAMRGLVPEPILDRRWKADFTHYINESTKRERPRVAELLASDTRAAALGYLRKGILPKSGDADGQAARRLQDIVALEVWLRAFECEPSVKVQKSASKENMLCHQEG